MQIKNNRANYLQNPWVIGVVKIGLLAGCIYFIITKFQDQSIDISKIQWPDDFTFTTASVFFLMFLNWYLEALRWKVSLHNFEQITISKAWQVILGGLALNWVLPFTSGDLIARISQQKDKYQATSAAILNRSIMLIFTLILGLYGVSYLHVTSNWNGWLYVLIIGIVLLALLIFRTSLTRFFAYFKELRISDLLLITLLSLVRYIVFVIQFYLLLNMFLPALASSILIAGIGWVFLVRSALPLFFGGVGVREASGILFFEPYVSELQLVLIPIFLIWVINTVIPSLVGLLFVWQMRPSSLIN